MLLKWKSRGEKHILPSPMFPTKSYPERFVKAAGQRPEGPSDLNLFHVKEVAEQETALHKPRRCSTLSAIYIGMHVQIMLYKIREH